MPMVWGGSCCLQLAMMQDVTASTLVMRGISLYVADKHTTADKDLSDMARRASFFLSLTGILLGICFVCPARASVIDLHDKKVLVVMSYHQGSQWQDDQRQGLESVLTGAQTEYFYLDTKRSEAGGAAKAKEALALYQKIQPDAVIAADDFAQALFVVPYLKDKVKTPVVFLGVNDDAAQYGFPASNVTGVIEVKHYKQSITFAQLLVPEIKRIAVLYMDNPTNRKNVEELKRQQATFSAEIVRFRSATTFTDLEKFVRTATDKVDAFLALNLSGLRDEAGTAMEATKAMAKLALLSAKPVIVTDYYDVEAGALCGVVKTGQEQGELAAHMVLDIFSGKAIKDIPVTKNQNGLRYINVTTARRLGVPLKSIAVVGTKLVK